MQKAQGTNAQYMISALEISAPDHAQLEVSSKLRSVIAVLAIGVIMLFVVVSIASGLAQRRRSPKLTWGADGAEMPPPQTVTLYPSADQYVESERAGST
jgi:hypothetical protein